MTLDTEKAFDSVNHLFLITVLENYEELKWTATGKS